MDTNSLMVLDSSVKSRPISVTVNDPNEINSLFDSISYEKVKLDLYFKEIFSIIFYGIKKYMQK
jgi:hypothetical protein